MTQIAILLIITTIVCCNAFNSRPKFGRIIGGEEATIEDNPWQASLQLLGFHTCAASIIDSKTLVTAAHCINLLEDVIYTVKIGTADLRHGGQKVGIAETVVHEGYSGLDFDIAIIKLDEEITFSDKIQPVKLPDENLLLEIGSEVKVSGWGVKSETGLLSESVLREVTVKLYSNEECGKLYSEYEVVTDRMLCAGVPEGGKDACQGDSGGPLVQNGTLIGIVSWGLGCAQANYPGVYTNVTTLVSWVKKQAQL